MKELALNAPTLIYTHVPQILEWIWVGLRDQRVVIREASAEALSACLQIINERESNMRNEWYRKITEEASKGLRQNSVEQIHGSLLVYRELLHHAKSVRAFINLLECSQVCR